MADGIQIKKRLGVIKLIEDLFAVVSLSDLKRTEEQPWANGEMDAEEGLLARQ